MCSDAAFLVDCAEPQEPLAGLGQSCSWRRIEEGQASRIGLAPKQAGEQQARQVRLEDFGRVVLRKRRGRCLLPQANCNARGLTRRAPGTLGHRRAAGALGDKPGQSGTTVVTRAPRQPAIHHDSNIVQRKAAFGDGRRKHQLAHAGRRRDEGSALGAGLDPSMEPVQHDISGKVAERIGGSLDFRHTGKEGEQRSFMLAERPADGRGHLRLDALPCVAADMVDGQGIARSLAFNGRRIAHQFPEPGSIERRRHRENPKVRPKPLRRVEREREGEVVIEAPFVHLVEQDRRNAGELGIGLDARQEYPVSHRDDPGGFANLAVEPGRVADRLPRLLRPLTRHEFGGGAGGQPAGNEQQHLPPAPRLVEQCGRYPRCLTRSGRRDQQCARPVTKRTKQVWQDGIYRQFGQAHCRPDVRL